MTAAFGHLPRVLVFVTSLLFVSTTLAADDATPLKFPDEQAAWATIAARFSSPPAAKTAGKTTEIAVTGLKSDPKGGGTASIQVDQASGHVVGISSNVAKFSDEEFKLFASFPEIRAVTLWHNSGDFTGKGIASLASLGHLEKLTLAGGSLDNTGMAEAAKLKNLKELRIWHCRFDDAGVALLRNHPAMESVAVGPMWDPLITDKSIESLAECPKLKKVGFSDTYLTWENGLKHLLKAKGLTDIDLGDCLIEPADVDRLKKEMPAAKIMWKGLAASGTALSKSYVRSKAQKWIPKELIDRAVAEAAKAEQK